MRVNVASIEFDNVTMKEAVERIVAKARADRTPGYVCTGNLDHLAMLQKDPEFKQIYAGADLVLPDGMPVVWLSRLSASGPLKGRVAGSDLFWELGEASAEHGLRLFLMGGNEGAADSAAEALRARFPKAVVCGTYCPPFESFSTEDEQRRIREAIRSAAPDVLMVGLGAPKQEKWIASNLDRLGVPVSIGVGGSFEMAAGIVPRAPGWAQRVGLEWLYRLLREPRRMWRRYLARDVPFLLRTLILPARWKKSA